MESLEILRNQEIKDYNELVEKYLQYIDVSNATEKEYYTGIKLFFQYCNLNNIDNVTRQDIIDYRNYLQQQEKAANTINLYLTSIKNFFKWLDFEGIYKDISKNIKALPVENTHIRESLDIDQVKLLLDNCQNDKEKLIITLAITTGIRCNEMCNIRIKDFVNKNGTNCLYVLGKARKGMKTDFVVIPDNVLQQVKEYINNNDITDYLFVSTSNNNKGNAISTRTMRDIVNKIYERAGIKNENVVFHSLRHSFATISIKNGSDIREVSQSLRHKSVATSMIYIHDLEMTENKCSNNISNLLFV